MAISVVQSFAHAQTGLGGSTTRAFPSNVTAGNTLYLFAASTSTANVLTVSDSLNGAWGAAAYTSNTSMLATLFVKGTTLGGACTVTYTFSVGGTATFAIFEVAGLGLPLLDQSAKVHSAGATGAGTAGPTGTTTQANEFVLAGFSGNNSSTWTNTGAGTIVQPAAAPINYCCIYQILSATGTASASWSNTTNQIYDGLITTWGSAATAAPRTTAGYLSIRTTSQS